MNARRRILIPFLLALVVCGAAGCDDDDRPTAPTGDTEPPALVLTSAPATSQAKHEVVLMLEITDDVALESVTIDWGVPGDALDAIPLKGTRSSISCAHTYHVAGQFSIVVQVRDASDHEATSTHTITITEFAPEAPAGLAASVDRTTVSLTWVPGAWAEFHEIAVSRTDAPEPDRVWQAPSGEASGFRLTGLSWDASYTVVVTAVNPWGRADSDLIAFRTAVPDPPLLESFSSASEDPTCLALKWTPALEAESFRVAITADGEQEAINQHFSSSDREAQFCAALYPIVDGMTYTAQVFSVIGAREYGSNSIVFTADFDPVYSASGSWTASMEEASGEVDVLRLHLEDDDGRITGSWEQFGIFGVTPRDVSGTRTWAAIDLTLHFWCEGILEYCPPNALTGEFTDADTIEASLSTGFFPLPLTLKRD